MKRGITIWENDMMEEIDPKIKSFIELRFKGYEMKQLSALSHRSEQDIFDSLEESYGIVIQPNLLEPQQIIEMAKLISHPIHGNHCSNIRNWDIQNFTFISTHPWETLKEIKSMLKDVKDNVGELCIMKILNACSIDFYNFDMTEYYELVRDGYWGTKAIRYK